MKESNPLQKLFFVCSVGEKKTKAGFFFSSCLIISLFVWHKQIERLVRLLFSLLVLLVNCFFCFLVCFYLILGAVLLPCNLNFFSFFLLAYGLLCSFSLTVFGGSNWVRMCSNCFNFFFIPRRRTSPRDGQPGRWRILNETMQQCTVVPVWYIR